MAKQLPQTLQLVFNLLRLEEQRAALHHYHTARGEYRLNLA